MSTTSGFFEHGQPSSDSTAAEVEARLRAATVGNPVVLNSKIELVPYDSAWVGVFESLAQRIRQSPGVTVLGLEHVGSTSVPGLSAKPVIDILLIVEYSSDEAAYVPSLAAAGFDLRVREPDWHEHRLLSPSDVRANVHIFSAGCPEIERMLQFRNRLRDDADDRALYEETKRTLASRTWRYLQQYADAKSSIVEAILCRSKRD